MQAGLYFGYATMCEGLIGRIRAELGEDVRVVATGGLAETLAVEIPSIGIALAGDRRAELRTAAPVPIVARVEDDVTICDLRTVDPNDDALLGQALRALDA